jgi:hypothetical protein
MKFAEKLKTLLSDKSAGGLYLIGENVIAERGAKRFAQKFNILDL